MPPVMPSGGGEQRDSGSGIVWMMFGVIIGVFGIWMAGHTYIVAGFFKLKLAEISLVNFFTDELGPVRTAILHTDPAQVSFGDLNNIAGAVGQYIKYPAALILLLLAILLYSKSSVSRFHTIYNMRSLLTLGVRLWPQSRPALTIDLIKEDINQGSWAMAMNPMQFAKRYRLLREKKAEFLEDRLSKEAKTTVSLIHSRANRIFTIQLGRQWQGIDKLSGHYKALYAAFAAKAARDSAGSREFLRKVADSYRIGKMNFSGTEELLAKHQNDPHVLAITGKHAYELTVMASLLSLARSDGVLPTADFMWLKPIDRSLWFMLNSVGRQTAVCEAAGPFAHWLAEKEMGRKIMTPMVEQASRALDVAIQDIKYNPDSQD